MESRTVGIKIAGNSISVQGIKIIRDNIAFSISEIKTRVQTRDYIYMCDYIDSKGVKLIIKLFTELKKSGIECELYEHDRLTDIKFLKNLNHSYDQIDKETWADMFREADDDD